MLDRYNHTTQANIYIIMCEVTDCASTKLYNGSAFCYRHRGQIKKPVVEEKPVVVEETSSEIETVDSEDGLAEVVEDAFGNEIHVDGMDFYNKHMAEVEARVLEQPDCIAFGSRTMRQNLRRPSTR